MPEALAPDYEIETLLGSGHSGTTYLARAEGTGALLAVKILTRRDESDAAPAVADALRGALTAFDHPGIARLHAVDVDADGHLRLIRDYIAGKPLAAWLAKADAVARQSAFDAVAAALASAHGQGLFHGHVVAANIIVAPGGRPILVDFGAQLAWLALQAMEADAQAMASDDRTALESLRSTLEPRP